MSTRYLEIKFFTFGMAVLEHLKFNDSLRMYDMKSILRESRTAANHSD